MLTLQQNSKIPFLYPTDQFVSEVEVVAGVLGLEVCRPLA